MKTQIKIDSGYIVDDPSDSNRSMLIVYNAESDRVLVFRRCEEVDTIVKEEVDDFRKTQTAEKE